MIRIYPILEETRVVEHDWDVILERLSGALNVAFTQNGMTMLLQGGVKDDTFNLTVRMRRHQFFMPEVTGRIEPTSKGSIVFLRYRLFRGTRVLLTFWTLLLPLIGIPLALESGDLWIIGGFILFAIIMHLIARASFAYYCKMTKAIIDGLLN